MASPSRGAWAGAGAGAAANANAASASQSARWVGLRESRTTVDPPPRAAQAPPAARVKAASRVVGRARRAKGRRVREGFQAFGAGRLRDRGARGGGMWEGQRE